MPVEIKELIIKTTVVNTKADDQKIVPSANDIRELKEQLLTACKAYLNEKLKEEKRR